MKKVFLQDHTP